PSRPPPVLLSFPTRRSSDLSFGGKLAPLRRVVSPEKVLTPELLSLAREVATYYAGTLADVLRLAIPPRHARVEKEEADHAEESQDRKSTRLNSSHVSISYAV